MDAAKENASVAAAASLTILGTTCCALPMVLVALGAGGAMASMASALPWLVALSKYKLATFGVTAAALAYSWWRVRALATTCDVGDARRLQIQKWVLRGATTVFGASVFSAYALLPLVLWLEPL